MKTNSLSDRKLIEAHKQAWEKWQEARTKGNSNSAEIGNAAALVIALENEAHNRKIPNSVLMAPIEQEQKSKEANKPNGQVRSRPDQEG